MKSTKLFNADLLRTNGFSPSPKKQAALEKALQGSEQTHEISTPSISFVAGFHGVLWKQNNDQVEHVQHTSAYLPLIPLRKW